MHAEVLFRRCEVFLKHEPMHFRVIWNCDLGSINLLLGRSNKMCFCGHKNDLDKGGDPPLHPPDLGAKHQ